MADNNIPNFNFYEDHPLHRNAKIRMINEAKGPENDTLKKMLHRWNKSCKVVKCPECGVEFDANLEINKVPMLEKITN